MPTDDTVDIDRDVVFGLDHLSWDTSQLDLDIWEWSARNRNAGVSDGKTSDLPTTRMVSEQTLTLTRPGSTDL